eukprot:TRINITY_DN6365_c0_g4_i1.p2 TRINITY_DN6365_c0_g4~~TRINITY_DN6365_c0_g4_i1.p2  ORF type:complete len:296 (+),score=114.71 TRINITY_DN6365_c0_g4_i1:79-888(+)
MAAPAALDPGQIVADTTIRFPPPPSNDAPEQTSITVFNNTDAKRTFKIKTTTPERYAVKPRMGVIEPHGKVDVDIVFRQPTTFRVPREQDKFQVATRPLSALEARAIEQGGGSEAARQLGAPAGLDDKDKLIAWLWNPLRGDVEGELRTALRCVFAGPDQAAGSAAGGTGGGKVENPAPGPAPAPAASEEKRAALRREIDALANGVQQEEAQIQKMRRKLRTETSVPLALALPCMMLAVILGYLLNERIPELAATEAMRVAGHFLQDYL